MYERSVSLSPEDTTSSGSELYEGDVKCGSQRTHKEEGEEVMNTILVLFGERVGDKKHILFHQSFGYTFREDMTKEDIENCITEVEGFLREVLTTKKFDNPLYRPYRPPITHTSKNVEKPEKK